MSFFPPPGIALSDAAQAAAPDGLETKRPRMEEPSLDGIGEDSMAASCISELSVAEESMSEFPPSVCDSITNDSSPPKEQPAPPSRSISRVSSAASQLSRIGSRIQTATSLCPTDITEYQWPAEDFTVSERSGPSRVSTPSLPNVGGTSGVGSGGGYFPGTCGSGAEKAEPDWYMVQELLSECLTIKSFKRKYPDLTRRTIDAWERQYLTQKGIITALGAGQADLGLTALRSDEVMVILEKDYPDTFAAVSQILQQRRIQSIRDKQKAQYQTCRVERGTRLEQARKRALKSVSEFNRNLLSCRRSERQYYWDMATFQIHVPQKCKPPMPTDLAEANPALQKDAATATGPGDTASALLRDLTEHQPASANPREDFRSDGCYPIAIIPGQFSQYFKQYTAHELGYLPVGRAIFQVASNKDLEKLNVENPSLVAALLPPRPDAVAAPSSTTTAAPANAAAPVTNGATAPVAAASETTPFAGDENSQGTLTGADDEATNDTAVSGGASNTTVDCTACGQPVQDPVRCSDCPKAGHARCMELPEHMREAIRSYSWSCMDCKKCVECLDPGHEDLMMFCDRCDRGYHAFCVGLEAIPEGNWECPSCAPDSPEDDLPLSKVKKTVRHKRSKRAIAMAAAAASAAAVGGDVQA